MTKLKRTLIICISSLLVLLLIPIIVVNNVEPRSGMLVSIVLFFFVNPVFSVVMGVLSGLDIKGFWYTPLIVAALFLFFALITFGSSFPVAYSLIYLFICAISMGVTYLLKVKK